MSTVHPPILEFSKRLLLVVRTAAACSQAFAAAQGSLSLSPSSAGHIDAIWRNWLCLPIGHLEPQSTHIEIYLHYFSVSGDYPGFCHCQRDFLKAKSQICPSKVVWSRNFGLTCYGIELKSDCFVVHCGRSYPGGENNLFSSYKYVNISKTVGDSPKLLLMTNRKLHALSIGRPTKIDDLDKRKRCHF